MKKISKQITLGFDPKTGKRIRTRIYATSKTGLQQAEKDAVREFEKHGISSRMTLGEYRKQWFDAYCSNLQPVTKTTYTSVLKNLDPLNGKRMDAITRTDLQKIINSQWEHTNLCKKLGTLINAIWRSAVIDGVVSVNIGHKLKRPERKIKARRALTEEELDGVKKASLDEQERFLVDVLLQFGLRPQEAFALNVNSFNRKDRTLTIDKAVAYDDQTPFVKETKTGVTRVLPVPDSFWPKIPKIDCFYYFTYKDGTLWKRQQTREIGGRIRDKINKAMGGTDLIRVTDLTLYYFRHNKATQLYYLPGVSLKKKAEYMGHSEEQFIKTYSHLDDTKEEIEQLRNAM